MELDEALTAVEEGKKWLRAAKLLKEGGLFTKSLYSLEMGLEISIKGVMVALHKNYPKRHDISDLLEEAVMSNKKKIPSEFIENLPQLVSAYRSLLRQRNAAGYGLKDDSDEETYMRFVLQSFGDIEKYVSLCDNLVQNLTEGKNTH